jgi:hypothetical protein
MQMIQGTSYRNTDTVTMVIPNAVAGQKYIVSVKYAVNTIVGFNRSGTALPATYKYIYDCYANGSFVNGTHEEFTMTDGCTVVYTRIGEQLAEKVETDGVALTSYPNPFNESTTVAFMSDESATDASIELYNSLGAKVATVFEGPIDAGFENEVTIDGTVLQEGVYYCRYVANGYARTIRIILIK